MAMRSALRSSLLVVSVVLMITTPQALLFNLSDIKDSVQPKAPVAEIGSPSFTFNCTVNQSSITAYDVVWKHYSVRLPPDWQHVVNATLIQLVIPNITEDSFGNYECRSRLENRLIGGAQLEVGYPPDQPKFERCQSNNLNDFTCWWNRGRDPILKTNYNLTYTFKVGKVRVCPDLRVKQNKLICSWNPSHGHPAMYGNEHRIVVTAENGLGKTTSVPKFLDPDKYVKPGNVLGVQASNVGADALTVSWSHPQGLEPSHFTLFYQVRYWSEWDQTYKEKNASTDRSLQLPDLNPFTEYTVCVRSHPMEFQTTQPTPQKFNGFWSDCAPNITVKTSEAAPSGQVEAWLLVTKDDRDQRNVKVLWKPLPPWDRHSEGTDYIVTYLPRSDDGTIVQSERKTFVFNNQVTDSGETLPSELFQDERTYEIRISANNSLGSTSATTMTVLKYQDTPSAPTDLSSVVLDNDTIQLSWQPLSPTRRETQLGGYIVFWREWVEVLSLYQWVEKGWAHVDSSQSTFEVTGLLVTKPTRFKFGVSAKTAGGFSTPVYIDNYTRIDEPQGSVEDVEVTPAGPSSLGVTWKPHPLQWRNGLLLGYRIRYCQVASCADPDQCSETREVSALGEDTTSHQLGGLQPYTSYRVQVEAFNTEGSSDLSDPPVCTHTEEAAPSDAPTNLTFVLSKPNLAALDWIPPVTPNGVITNYNAKVNGDLRELSVTLPPVTLSVRGDTSYNISVQACTAECGPLSAPVSFRTPIGAPGPPPIPQKQKSSDSSIVLQLSAPNISNGPIHRYVVFYSPQNSTAGVQNMTVGADEDTVEVTIENCAGPVMYNFWVRAVNVDTNGKWLIGEKSPVLEHQMCGGITAGASVPVTIIVIVAALVVTLLSVGCLFKKNKDSLKKKLFPHVPGPVLPYFYDEYTMDPYDSTYSQLNFPTINYSYNNDKEQVDNIADFLNRGTERSRLVHNDANMNTTMPISDTVDKVRQVDKKPVEENSTDDRRSSGYSTSTDPAVSEAEPADNSRPKGPDTQPLQTQLSTQLGGQEESPSGHGQPSVSPEGIELAEMGAASAEDPPAGSQESPIQDVADYLKTADGIMDYVRMGAGGDYEVKSGVDAPDYLQTYTLRNDAAKLAPEKAKPMDGYVRAATGKPGQFVEPDYQTRYSLESLPVTSGSSGYKSNESQPSTTAEEPPSPESQLKNYISKSMPNILQGFPFAPATVAGVTMLTPGKAIPNHAAENTTYIKTAGEINV
ncbi:uncharacterized protein [Branchiostoma lanceolatum]|uniref:uncharacterized protein isoform X1 n=1 Tax=Branchiostoma lanceolatum TaxID=7740 RepID=UPI0034519A4C